MEKKMQTTLEYILKHITNICSNIKDLRQGQEQIESRLDYLEELIKNAHFEPTENPDAQVKDQHTS